MKLASDGYFDAKISKTGRWWDKNAEIDIVGVNEESKPLLFGKYKYTNKPVGLKTLFEFFEKTENNFDVSAPIFLIYSKSDFSNELLDYAIKHQNVYLFNLFKPVIM